MVWTVPIAARFVARTAPDLILKSRVAWQAAAAAVAGESAEVDALVRPLIDHGRIGRDELIELGWREPQRRRGTARVVLRRHARVAPASFINSLDLAAAQLLARSGPSFELVLASSPHRAQFTAHLWAENVILDERLDIDDRAERVVGDHAGFRAWTNAPADYLALIGELIDDLLGVARDGLVLAITHDGVPQAVVAALGLELLEDRGDALDNLEGVAIGQRDGKSAAWRVGAPPAALLGSAEG